jgi:hypothetical protein
VIRTGKDTGLGHFPSRDYGLSKAWLDASMTACALLSWLRLLALDGKLAKAEPKTLRYRVFHAAARLVRGGRRKTLNIAAAVLPDADLAACLRQPMRSFDFADVSALEPGQGAVG